MPRRLGHNDAAGVVAVLHAAFSAQSVPTDPPSAALAETVSTIGHAIVQGGGAGVEAGVKAGVNTGGALVGAVLWVEQEGGMYCSRLAVAPAWRGQGIARALLQEAEREARRRGLPRLQLSTRLVLMDNRRLFAACGFQEGAVATHAGYAAPTSVAMQKVL